MHNFTLLVTVVLWAYVCSQIGVKASEKYDPASLQLLFWKRQHQHSTVDRCTTSTGNPYPSLTSTETIGRTGPALLQDRFLLERTAFFNRERIQERKVHAKGAGAFGTFTVTHDISRWTKAKVFNYIGKQTKVFLRFSLTAGEFGYPDTIRDGKGFALKFYTEDGNWDIVGNQIEVFHSRDPMQFADINTSRKRNPQTNLNDHTMVWDLVQQRPETIHHFVKLFSDIGTPESLRMVNGSGVHTFKLVNAHNEPFYCKFHFFSQQKFQVMSKERQVFLAGSQPNHWQEDLYNSIVSQNYPRWIMAVQIATPSQAENYQWDYLDITKNWRFEDFPPYPVGVLELDRMPVDFFAYTEQSAFGPGNMVPGVEPSNDRMLHARIFNYPDAQRYRLGISYNSLPINRPLYKVVNYDRDGMSCFSDNGNGGPNYHPNSFGGPEPDPNAKLLPFFLSGEVSRSDTRDADNFSQAALFLEKDISPEEKRRVAENMAESLALVASVKVRELVFQNVLRPLGGDFEQLVRHAMNNILRNPAPEIVERS